MALLLSPTTATTASSPTTALRHLPPTAVLLWLWLSVAVFVSSSALPHPSPNIFQQPPKPLAVWQEPVALPSSFQRPLSWEEKDFGQWCRNFR
jgi:hypothetical protein